MHIKPGFLLKKIAGTYTAIPLGDNYNAVGALISLNDSGAFLWHCMSRDCTCEELQSALEKEYQIDSGLAKQAVSEFVALLQESGLLDE